MPSSSSSPRSGSAIQPNEGQPPSAWRVAAVVIRVDSCRLGITPRVFERRSEPRWASRSIGIHPPSLELLAELGLADAFTSRGVHVARAEAHGEGGRLGTLDFATCRPPFRYILTLPQVVTEGILREALEAQAPGCVRTADVRAVEAVHDEHAIVHMEVGSFERFDAVVACDGKYSVVRKSLGVAFEGSDYPGEYAMADFPDTTSLGDTAAIYLDRRGLIESFPLPGGLRRWVARCDEGRAPTTAELIARVEQRTGTRLDASAASFPSKFRAQRFQASRFAVGVVALAGDAAHVVSPIGGQGMNLGWLGARSIAEKLAAHLGNGGVARALAADARERKRIATTTARRAELNMWLGKPGGSRIGDRVLGTLIETPARFLLARAFSMRGLSLGI